MAESQVTRKQTPITMPDWTRANILAWKKVFGTIPTKEQLAVLWGQLMVETSGNAIWNYNYGNVKHVDGDGYDWIDLPGTWEMVGGQKVVLPEGHPGRRFRAYKSSEHGMESHLKFLQKKFGNAWQEVLNGRPREFAYRLKDRNYYTADKELYANIVESHFRNYLKNSSFETIAKTIDSMGKPSPSVSEPALSGEESRTESGTSSTNTSVVDFKIVHKSPFDEEK